MILIFFSATILHAQIHYSPNDLFFPLQTKNFLLEHLHKRREENVTIKACVVVEVWPQTQEAKGRGRISCMA